MYLVTLVDKIKERRQFFAEDLEAVLVIHDLCDSGCFVGEMIVQSKGQYVRLDEHSRSYKGASAPCQSEYYSVIWNFAESTYATMADGYGVEYFVANERKCVLRSNGYSWVQCAAEVDGKRVDGEVGLLGQDIPYASECLAHWHRNKESE